MQEIYAYVFLRSTDKDKLKKLEVELRLGNEQEQIETEIDIINTGTKLTALNHFKLGFLSLNSSPPHVVIPYLQSSASLVLKYCSTLLVLGFMLMVNSLWNSIGDTYTKNMVAYILLCMILAYDYVERVGRKKNETK